MISKIYEKRKETMINEKYKEYLSYVRTYLTEHNGINSPNPLHPFRSRYHHTIRVLHWCFRLTEEETEIDKEALYIAAIFHDIGYTDRDNENHAERSCYAFREYAKKENMSMKFIDKVADMILYHSDKSRIKKPETSRELVLLMEADLLDEEGAMGIVWDCMTLGNAHTNSYGNAYHYIMENSNKPEPNPMITPKAIAYWEKKKRIAAEFAEELENDLMIESDYFEF